MSIKRDELANSNSCLNKAADDEPIFVLRAQDMLSDVMVEIWCVLAAAEGCTSDKLNEARALAEQMREWPARKVPD